MDSQPARFGTQLGVAPGGVPVYSSHYPSADPQEYPDRESYRSYLDGHFMGYKWQCVEFARRWLYLNHGYVFEGVPMAYDIFDLRTVKRVEDRTMLPLQAIRNGSFRRPEPGALLIWGEGGAFVDTGHVAVITEVLEDRVRIAEQNVGHNLWEEGFDYAREIPMQVDADGACFIHCDKAEVLGWMLQSADQAGAEPEKKSPVVHDLKINHLSESPPRSWLNESLPDEQAYGHAMGGAYLARFEADRCAWLSISESTMKALKHATNDLHAMFMHATHRVLMDDGLLQRFNLPRSIWPRLRASWNNRRNEMITGRFDFAVSKEGIKVYEYNADSASCYLEAGKLQQQWFEAAGVEQGRCPGGRLFADLVHAWHSSETEGPLHILQDEDAEEQYHALYIQAAAEAAGIRCKPVVGMRGLGWDPEGHVVDADGERINWVWKTWAWETALDQLREECDEEAALAAIGQTRARAGVPRLVDLLLRPGVMVYEPLWTLVPSNKAILPVLWELFPNHPCLLHSAYELDSTLSQKGYVAKPIAGRCGFNISMVGPGHQLLEASSGQFSEQDQVYQQLYPLPKLEDYFVQVGTFTVDGKFSAACIRADRSPLITTDSDLFPLRVLADETWGAALQDEVNPAGEVDSVE
ncbi:glutathionylspermidine synthase family protein [Aestuariirhabdus litorea]|uniref:CHAP domain-containing protein n=1 Tax=Aestuariirhabdus litorea TaxID=2528527 RepID=A0A3P3VSV8_9GAMM|nr:glutathionylspermidine synthase family protein [Aestuariirhabdus litorea]RRJ85068.1 CHAP domain-containing protein [Aestuariirhabdus litorea]RWW98293.1 CHAP domain-containing protein [Endozoicomonadaceae bacterium GTF-13]